MLNEEINPPTAARIKREVSKLNYHERKDYLQQNGYPLKLYKYIPETYNKKRLEQYLLKVECWLSNPRTFNDPFDMNAKIEFDAHVLEKRKKLANLLTADERAWSRQERWEIDTHDQITKILLRKHKSWDYEKERRVIIFGKPDTAIKLNPHALTGIIKGINFSSSSFKRNLLAVIKKRGSLGLPKLNLYEAILNKNEEKIELVSCA
jgi:hypothetical protein